MSDRFCAWAMKSLGLKAELQGDALTAILPAVAKDIAERTESPSAEFPPSTGKSIHRVVHDGLNLRSYSR